TFPGDARARGRRFREIKRQRAGRSVRSVEMPRELETTLVFREEKSQRIRRAGLRIGTTGLLVLLCGPAIHRLQRAFDPEFLVALGTLLVGDAELVYSHARLSDGREIEFQLLLRHGFHADDGADAVVILLRARGEPGQGVLKLERRPFLRPSGGGPCR